MSLVNDKAADMAHEADEFASMAKKLRQQAEKQSRWLPF